MASTKTERNEPGVTFEKSGINRIFKPSRPVLVVPSGSVCDKVREKIAIITTSISKIGIRNLDNFSIPLTTPCKIISAHIPKNMNI